MSIDRAIDSFESGKLVAIPTETVYGLAAPISKLDLVKKIFTVKERPFFDPLIVHVSSIDMAKEYCTKWSDEAQILAEKFWPGPLTLVLPKSAHRVDDVITSGLSTVGIRMPKNEVTLELIQRVGCGLAAPSANKFTKVSPTTAQHVREYFNESDVYILDAKSGEVGIESTIIDLSGPTPKLLRPGAITTQEIEEALGNKGVVEVNSSSVLSAPGQFQVHYRPPTPLVVTTRPLTEADKSKIRDQIKFAFEFANRISLELQPQLAARSLYTKLRETPPKEEGFNLIDLSDRDLDNNWDGILDRLKKAAALFFIR